MKVSEVIDQYFINLYGLNSTQEIQVEYVYPVELITSSRIDIVSKVLWIKMHKAGYSIHWIDDVYSKFIRAITNETYAEVGKENTKNTLDAFKEEFVCIYDDIGKNGFCDERSIIPVAENGGIMDGAHRVAASYAIGVKVPIHRFPGINVNNDLLWFKSKYVDDNILDYVVTEYCKIKKDVFAICIWPRAYEPNKRLRAEEIIESNTKVIYKKEIDLNERGLVNFVIQVYCEMDWLGNQKDGFKGAKEKAAACYKEKTKTIVYFVEGITLSKAKAIKQDIRDLFDISNHSVHITDNGEETINIAYNLLNDNSLELLNVGDPLRYDLGGVLDEFLKEIKKRGHKTEDYIIDSSGTMALYGIRNCNDIDFLTMTMGIEGNSKFENHADYLKYYDFNINELLYDPRLHLYYRGIKFVSLKQVRQFKINRKEKKDLNDVNLIDDMYKPISINKLIHQTIFYYNRSLFRLKVFIKQQLKKYRLLYTVLKNIKERIDGRGQL